MRIAEYKQIDTKVETYKVPILDDEGNETGEFGTMTREIPVMGMVYRDATNEDIASMQVEQLKPQSAELSDEEKLRMLIDSMPVEKPTAGKARSTSNDLPFKLGYKWEPRFDGTKFYWEAVEDPNAIGTEQNPIIWYPGVRAIPNARYNFNDKQFVWMGQEGISESEPVDDGGDWVEM